MEGDVRDRLKDLAPASVQCIVTSPPYWGLRDYGEPGQLGLEATPEEYVGNLVEVFRELRRVLRDDGTAWLNLGDTYATSGGQRAYGSSDHLTGRGPAPRRNDVGASGLKPKDLCMIPARVAIALQADGWWLRSDTIWNKPNPMPESCIDRPTKAHEYIFLLTKCAHYFYDAEAIKEEATGTGGGAFGKVSRPDEAAEAGAQARRYDRPDYRLTGRNARSVWTMPTHSYPGAHFATFPEALPERCILAGTSEAGRCACCGTSWQRIVEKSRSYESGSGRSGRPPSGKNGPTFQTSDNSPDVRCGPVVHSVTLGWRPDCECEGSFLDPQSNWEADPGIDVKAVPCVVLDPFSGSGTTGVVACKLGREYIGIELNPEYAQLSRNRIGKALSPSTHVDETTAVDAPLFNPDQEQSDGKDT